MPIEAKFNKEILTEDGNYDEIYKKHLAEWQLTIWKVEHMDIRIVEINRQYFSSLYAPAEKMAEEE